jgi:hypothetical protein
MEQSQALPHHITPIIFQTGLVDSKQESWSRLSEQIFRVDKWSVHRGYAAKRIGGGLK